MRSAIALACAPFFIKLLLLALLPALGEEATLVATVARDEAAPERDGDAGLAAASVVLLPSPLPPDDVGGSPPGGSHAGSYDTTVAMYCTAACCLLKPWQSAQTFHLATMAGSTEGSGRGKGQLPCMACL